MAILKNLIVNGSSRFLNTAYFQDVSIDSLSLSGNLSVTGTSTLTGHVSIGGYNNTSCGLSASSAIINSWIRTTGKTGWYNQTYDGGWWMQDSNYVRSYNKPVLMEHNLYFNSTSYYVNTSGAASFSSIASPSATISNATVTGDLTVNGVLQANDFIKNIVKAVGGQLYVSPTFQALSSTTVTCTAVTATQLSLTLSDNAINGTDYAGATWYKDSKVMLSGTLTANTTGHTEEIIFSSVPGVVTANMSSSNKLQIKLDYDKASTYFKTGALTTSDVAVMMYQINIPSGSANAGLHPIGIYIKAYGTDNKNSYIDIFGGTSNTPNARLGLLNGLPNMQNGTQIKGWGIATTNGFFDGTIVSSSGKIGAFTLSSDLRSGTWGTSGSVLVAGGYTPTTADAKSIGGSPTTGNTWAFTAGSAFGVTTAGKIYASDAEISGKITATSGTIGGVTANSSYGLYTNSKTSATSTNTGFLISKDGAIYLGAYNSTNKACPFQVTSAGVLTATGATINGTLTAGANSKIGPWHVTTTSIYKSNATMGASTSGAAYFGNDGLSVTDKFKVTSAGALTATGVDVSGKITATEGAIGGFDITPTAIKTKNVEVTSNADNSISLSSADFKRTINSTPREGLRFAIGDKFGVTGDGTIYAGSANISGTLSAGANSTIGPWTVSNTSIYKGSATFGIDTSGAAYFGNDGLSIGGLLKIDARSGADTTISLGDTSSSNIAISSSGLMINNNTTPMATFNTDGIEMRGTDEQLLLDINTTGDPVTQSDSIVFSIQPIEVDSTHIFKLNEDKNENLRNVIGDVNVIVTFINGQEPSVLDTFTFNLNSDYNKNMGSGFTFNYKSKVSTFDDPYFSITCSGIVYGSECELVIDISWNYKQYPYNYTFGTRSKYGVRGIGSAIIGKNLENTNDNALVVGQYNKNGNYLFAVGNGGSDSNRSNAFTVDNYGVVGFSGVAMFGDPGGTFYIGSYVVVNNASVASQSYKEGTRTIELAGYYPLCVAGYNSNTRYLTPVRFYLSDQQSGSGLLNYMIFNPTSSARTGTCTIWVMWVKTT